MSTRNTLNSAKMGRWGDPQAAIDYYTKLTEECAEEGLKLFAAHYYRRAQVFQKMLDDAEYAGTPGPWGLTNTGKTISVVADPPIHGLRRSVIATIKNRGVVSNSLAEANATARLIVAAPAMRDTLIYLAASRPHDVAEPARAVLAAHSLLTPDRPVWGSDR